MKVTDVSTKSNLKHVQEFVEKLRPAILSIYEKRGFLPQVLLAQIALETGWCKHITRGLLGGNGPKVSTNNLFNIKVGSSWKGAFATRRVLEFKAKVIPYFPKASFRVYVDYEESINDYCNLIEKTSRYKYCIEHLSDQERYIDGLVKGGYATDPKYKRKLITVITKYFLVSYEADYRDGNTIKVSKNELNCIKKLSSSIVSWTDEVLRRKS